jgi:hypothetical protein
MDDNTRAILLIMLKDSNMAVTEITKTKTVTSVWNTAQCSLVEVDRCVRSACCLHHQNDRYVLDIEIIIRENLTRIIKFLALERTLS